MYYIRKTFFFIKMLESIDDLLYEGNMYIGCDDIHWL